MPTEPATNGSAATNDGMSAAERLMKQHAADESHKVTVEDVPDEDQVAHPPPSTDASHPTSTDPSHVAAPSADAGMSAKAAGKQPMREEAAATAGANKPRLDTQSEEAFPALGPAKTRPSGAAPSPWSRKPATVAKAAANSTTNGLANGHTAPSNLSSRASTPQSGMLTPTSAAPSQRGPLPQMQIPGRQSEQIQLHPSMMTPRNQLKKPVSDILRDINKRSKAQVEMKSGPGGLITFEGIGPTDAVRVALKEVANQLCSRVSQK